MISCATECKINGLNQKFDLHLKEIDPYTRDSSP